jgi:uncharacterized protein YtpQ (UPF0354 family)
LDKNFLEEREVPPMSAEMFSALVTARLRPVPEIVVESGRGLELKLRVRGQDKTAHLDRSYERYRANQGELTPVVDQLIQSLLNGEESALAGTAEFDSIADKLLPRLVTAQQWMDKRNDGLRLVVRPVVQDLGMAVVIDRATEFEYVEIDAVPAWGVDSQMVYETCLSNLEAKSAQVRTQETGQNVELLLIDHAQDGLAAERALLYARRRAWESRIQGELVLGMPRHDLLVGFSREHPAFDALREQVAEDAAQEGGLMAHLLTVRDGELARLD